MAVLVFGYYGSKVKGQAFGRREEKRVCNGMIRTSESQSFSAQLDFLDSLKGSWCGKSSTESRTH